MKLNSQDLDKIADVTLDFYNRHAENLSLVTLEIIATVVCEITNSLIV